MKYSQKLLTLAVALILFVGAMAVDASAQVRRGVRIIRRPAIGRVYAARPFYRSPYYGGYRRYWNRGFYDPFYDVYLSDPYLRAQRQRYYAQEELKGNQRELSKHLEKYNRDGVLTAKEREELNDDYRDVARAKRELREFDNR